VSGWCPRCDAVRAADGACPECGTPLVRLEREPQAPPRPAEPVAEVSAVLEAPPSARLRVALAVAAVVLTGLAFVAGRGTGRTAPRAAPATAPATTIGSEPAPLAQRRLDWQARPVRGVTFSALSLRRVSGGDPNGDDVGQLTIRVQGLPAGRLLLGLQGLELLDVGGGVFASPEERAVAGTQAALVERTGPEGTYVVDLGPTPGVDTLARIRLEGIVLSRPASSRSRVELDTSGSWPARPPLRAIEPADDSVTVDLSSLNLSDFAGGELKGLPLQVAGAFVGAGRAVVALRIGGLPGIPPSQTPQVLGRQAGEIPVSARLLAGDRVVCERTAMLGQGPDGAPVVAVACPTTPAPKLAIELGAGVQTAPLRATLPA
jgi:hypothetical protein